MTPSIQQSTIAFAKQKILWLIVTLLCSCSLFDSDELAGGGNTSGTETITVVSSTGVPLSGASIRILDGAKWDSIFQNPTLVLLDTLKTNDQGQASFKKWTKRNVNLVIQSHGEALILTNYEFKKETLKLKSGFRFNGSIASNYETIRRIALRGTDLFGLMETQGEYSFTDLPTGTYQPVIEYENKEIAPLQYQFRQPQADTTQPFILVAPNKIVLDHFEDGDSLGALTQYTHASKWFVFTDWEFGGTSTITPATSSQIKDFIFDTNGVSGKYLDVNYQVNTTGSSNWALIGLDLGVGDVNVRAPNVFADLSTMDSITFNAKGSGWFLLVLNTRKVMVELGNDSHYQARVDVNSNWTRHTIKPSEIMPGFQSRAGQLGLTWRDVSSGVSNIKFQAFANAHIQIDQIEIHGVKELVFNPPVP